MLITESPSFPEPRAREIPLNPPVLTFPDNSCLAGFLTEGPRDNVCALKSAGAMLERLDAVPASKTREAWEAYGRRREGLHITGYSFERACENLEWLLVDERWALGSRFTDVNAFIDSIRLDQFRAVAEQRKRIARRIKELQPEVSNRRIAKTLGVGETTVRRNTAPNGAAAGETFNENNRALASSAPNDAHELSGAKAARRVREIEEGLSPSP